MSRETIQRLIRISMVIMYIIIIVWFNNFIPSLVAPNDVSTGHIDNKTTIAIFCWCVSWLALPAIILGISLFIKYIWTGEGEIIDYIGDKLSDLEDFIYNKIGDKRR